MRLYVKSSPRAKKGRAGILAMALVLLGLFLILFYYLLPLLRRPAEISSSNKIISPISTESATAKKRDIFGSLLSVFKPSLREKIEKEIAGAKGTYGIVIKDLQSGEMLKIREEETFYMASLYKMIV